MHKGSYTSWHEDYFFNLTNKIACIFEYRMFEICLHRPRFLLVEMHAKYMESIVSEHGFVFQYAYAHI